MEYNLENYKAHIAEIEKEMQAKKDKLIREYASANNPYKIGDIITDSIGSLIIEKINFVRPSYNTLPSCVYYGTELKKDGTPMKRQSKRPIYQNYIIKDGK